uniref:Histone RNA hairpin-binding protein (inferred by orthology to a C. elegans protein) n=1 Tax=Strongyloides venezuelensis TaxID=75913 RepID=A0A0K0F341_STRVS
MSQRSANSSRHCTSYSPVRRSPRVSKDQQKLNDLSNTELDKSYQKLLEESEELKNKSWVDVCENEMKSKCNGQNTNLNGTPKLNGTRTRIEYTNGTSAYPNSEGNNLSNSVSSGTRSRKQVAPKKSSTTPRFLRSRAREQNDEETSSRKRRMDRSRSIIKDEASNSNDVEMKDLSKSPRKRFCNSQSSLPNNNELKVKEGWSEPKLGWCKDPEVLARRTKEIEKAKEKAVYSDYLEAIPKYERVKGIHPKTPNRFINYSRRSWDAQMKLWKRSLYDFFGRTPDTSCRTTPRVSRDTSPVTSVSEDVKRTEEVVPNIGSTEFSIGHLDPDRMSSLLSKFEMDSRKKFRDGDDESTLKAPTTQSSGPTTFANVI